MRGGLGDAHLLQLVLQLDEVLLAGKLREREQLLALRTADAKLHQRAGGAPPLQAEIMS